MNTLTIILLFLVAVTLVGYGIKRWFDYKIHQGKETSNSTVRRAISALLLGFIALVGLAPLLIDIVIQLLNEIPGVNLANTQSNLLLGGIAFLILCISVVAIIYFYYRNRHRLYQSENEKKSGFSKNTSDSKKVKTSKRKNIISNSKIKVKGDFRLGDDMNK